MSTDVAPEIAVPARGRPRKFTDTAVLDALVALFWEQGYESTSLADIVAATGLNKSSLYNSFGSKEELFQMALNRYADARSEMMFTVLGQGTRGLDDVTAWFEGLWSEVTAGGNRHGCLVVNTSTEFGQREPGVTDIGTRFAARIADGLRAAFTRAANLGEVDPENIEAYTAMIASFMVGVAVTVRSGATNQEIRAQLDAAEKVLDTWRLE
jgi:AcrR family transcriptional regulator